MLFVAGEASHVALVPRRFPLNLRCAVVLMTDGQRVAVILTWLPGRVLVDADADTQWSRAVVHDYAVIVFEMAHEEFVAAAEMHANMLPVATVHAVLFGDWILGVIAAREDDSVALHVAGSNTEVGVVAAARLK